MLVCHGNYPLIYRSLQIFDVLLDALGTSDTLGSSLCSCRTVRACLDLLLSWIHRYIDSLDSSDKQACVDVTLHGPFYSACQAAFYTLIFRHRAMLEGNMKKGAEGFFQRWFSIVIQSPNGINGVIPGSRL